MNFIEVILQTPFQLLLLAAMKIMLVIICVISVFIVVLAFFTEVFSKITKEKTTKEEDWKR